MLQYPSVIISPFKYGVTMITDNEPYFMNRWVTRHNTRAPFPQLFLWPLAIK